MWFHPGGAHTLQCALVHKEGGVMKASGQYDLIDCVINHHKHDLFGGVHPNHRQLITPQTSAVDVGVYGLTVLIHQRYLTYAVHTEREALVA